MDEVVYMPPHTNPAPFGAFGWGAFRRRPPPPPLAEPLCDNAWLVIGRPERRLPPAPPLADPPPLLQTRGLTPVLTPVQYPLPLPLPRRRLLLRLVQTYPLPLGSTCGR